ncbi:MULTISPECIES: hypothetical protein [Paracoccus]|jgi:hypothetical protein|uniref:Copper-binding protein n=2 Tax=Paracoccus TaxID=265 RepID=A1B6E4_PARDP|nr:MULTISPECIES: hypothetical protein [Paracoccus]ABL71088.1 hypothetical protein Pden_3005 [Paracoccus denitrificans PD1222]MBB4628313.1 hypothetical protein [Paracoccus denitrificans]MCU7429368.1 hypothetical protein [Paracoccus denitrificans]QAR27752.1 hypothetical protein EO213_15330 [Paracoccus denitrificans]QLH14878.1 hypothetical protein HYQ43_11405 [Paracoccus pantotrophus]
MNGKFVAIAFLTANMAFSASAQPAPLEELFLKVAAGEDGKPTISQDEFQLSKNEYYRLNFVCAEDAGDTGFQFESVPLLSNSHLRVISIEGQEIHIQGLSFHALQCDEAGTIRFSFYPIRSGTFEFTVQDHEEPANIIRGKFVVE